MNRNSAFADKTKCEANQPADRRGLPSAGRLPAAVLAFVLMVVAGFSIFALLGGCAQREEETLTAESTEARAGTEDVPTDAPFTTVPPTSAVLQETEEELITQATETVPTESVASAETDTTAGSGDETRGNAAAHIWPEDPWGLVQQGHVTYTKGGAAYDTVFPYLIDEVYNKERNSYYSYGFDNINDNASSLAARTAISEASQNDYPLLWGFDYEVHTYDGLLTIVLCYSERYDFEQYKIYVIDTENDFIQLNTKQILARMGVSEDVFLEACVQAKQTCFLDEFSENGGWDRNAEYWQEAYQRAGIASLDYLIYPDENGRLHVMTPVPSLVDADYYDHLLALELP